MSLKPYVDDVRRVSEYVTKMVSCFGAFDLQAEKIALTPEARLLCIDLPRLLKQLDEQTAA